MQWMAPIKTNHKVASISTEGDFLRPSAWAPQGSSSPGVYCTVLPPFQKGELASLQP